MSLDYVDHADDPEAWARSLDVSLEAVELLLAADFIDLHLDLDVPIRVIRWNPAKNHRKQRSRPVPYMGQTDFPRLREASLTGAVYDMPTNPFRSEKKRQRVTLANIARAQRQIADHPQHLALARNRTEYDAARIDGKLAFWLSLQGGNAFCDDPEVLLGPVGDVLHRITLIHLTTSGLGGTNTLGVNSHITDQGRQVVELCNHRRVIVDLAHASKNTFWGALEVHASHLPPIVSHTGIESVHDHWRNIDDDQIRAIADRGGVIGIMYQGDFLTDSVFNCRRSLILDHAQHVIDLVGDDFVAIGTDYDGMIVPPVDLVDVTHHPKLVQDALNRGWSPDRIRKMLGLNYLRVVAEVRP